MMDLRSLSDEVCSNLDSLAISYRKVEDEFDGVLESIRIVVDNEEGQPQYHIMLSDDLCWDNYYNDEEDTYTPDSEVLHKEQRLSSNEEVLDTELLRDAKWELHEGTT